VSKTRASASRKALLQDFHGLVDHYRQGELFQAGDEKMFLLKGEEDSFPRRREDRPGYDRGDLPRHAVGDNDADEPRPDAAPHAVNNRDDVFMSLL
jgi:hypothetical protein